MFLLANQLSYLHQSLWVVWCLAVVLLLLWLSWRLYNHEKQLKNKLAQQNNELQNVQLRVHAIINQNKSHNILFTEQLQHMLEQVKLMQSDFKEELKATDTLALFSDYENTLTTYTRMWQKV